MKLLAVIVTYFPNKKELEKNISSYINDVDEIIIWENTPINERCNYRLPDIAKITYCGDGVNSISRGLNYAWNYAKNKGIDYLLTMDQDSEFCDFKKYLSLTIHSQKAPNGIYIPRIEGNEAFVADFQKVYRSYTSGTLISIDILNMVGGYRTDFDVDAIDFELTTKAIKYNIPTYIVNGALMIHHFGELHKVKNTCLSTYNYGERRLYGMMKNHMVVLRQYNCIPFCTRYKIIRNFFIIMPIKVLFFETNGMNKFRSCIKGIIAGLKYKF